MNQHMNKNGKHPLNPSSNDKEMDIVMKVSPSCKSHKKSLCNNNNDNNNCNNNLTITITKITIIIII